MTIVLHPQRWTVRSRSAVLSTMVVAICLLAAGSALLVVLYNSLEMSARTAADARGVQVAEQLEAHAPADLDESLLATDSQVGIVQILDRQGSVVAASTGDADVPVSDQAVPQGESVNLGHVQRGDDYDYWVTAIGTTSPVGSVTVLVGADREPVEKVLEIVAVLLAIGGPLVILLVALATYRLVGSALSPVERIRTRVSSISTGQLAERVPVPESKDEIARLATTMNEMLTRLEAGQAVQRRFVGDASHELRSPLSTITAALELAASRPDLLDRELIDESLLPEARRMSQLIEDLLLLARSDDSTAAPEHVDVDLDDVMYFEVARIKSSTSLTVTSSIAPVRVAGDRGALGRVVRNLVDNSIRHAHSTIDLASSMVDGFAVVTVEDDGAGIPAEDRTRVLGRFVRLDSPRARESGGSGLGLAIAREIVAGHHGTIAIADRADGTGTRVTVIVPVE